MAETETADRPAEWTLQLRKPIETPKGPVGYLELREPTIGEVEKAARVGAKDGNILGTLSLIQMMTGIDRPFLEKLSARDFNDASDYLVFFIEGSQKDGSKPSPI